MTSKDRSYLKGLAQTEDAILSLGKSGVTPDFCKSVEEALVKRELVKINVLKNADDEPETIARMISERTRSEVVQIIGRKIVFYKKNKEKAGIVLPSESKSKKA
ncbi:MAG: YhbY family RNA-binding protein [Eubacterium sp.]|nr:YhbY family RNA-binding protein [Eubacterium sp.]MCR5292325.1 YhbY family RNA-binding protein [Eubacterium sp.]